MRRRPCLVASVASESSTSRTTASGIRRCSINGEWRGENSRPLNAVTSRSPALHPECARREIACSADQSPRGDRPDGTVGQGVDRVGLAIHVVPHGDQRVRLCEQQKQHSIDDGQRLIEGDRATAVSGPARLERRRQKRQRTEHAVAERPADTRCMRIGSRQARSERPRCGAGHRARVSQRPQDSDPARAEQQPLEIKLDAGAGPRPGAIRDAQRAPVGDDRPVRSRGQSRSNRVAPSGRWAATPTAIRAALRSRMGAIREGRTTRERSAPVRGVAARAAARPQCPGRRERSRPGRARATHRATSAVCVSRSRHRAPLQCRQGGVPRDRRARSARRQSLRSPMSRRPRRDQLDSCESRRGRCDRLQRP